MGKYRMEHLISSMNENDFSLLEKSHIQTDALLINQCAMESKEQIVVEDNEWRMIRTKERGLSRSRNLAIKNAKGDICLFCDNDELFRSDYSDRILKSYEMYQDADLIVFALGNQPKRIKNIPHQMSYLELLRVSSWQISFRRDSVQKKKIYFDERMGAGTGNGAEEEVKFLMDCYKAKLKIWYVPEIIADLVENESTWFHGYDKIFFENRGMTTRYILGLPLSVLYGIYYVIRKKELYRNDLSMWEAAKALFKGIRMNRLGKNV